jgi:hypothetical protein
MKFVFNDGSPVVRVWGDDTPMRVDCERVQTLENRLRMLVAELGFSIDRLGSSKIATAIVCRK